MSLRCEGKCTSDPQTALALFLNEWTPDISADEVQMFCQQALKTVRAAQRGSINEAVAFLQAWAAKIRAISWASFFCAVANLVREAQVRPLDLVVMPANGGRAGKGKGK